MIFTVQISRNAVLEGNAPEFIFLVFQQNYSTRQLSFSLETVERAFIQAVPPAGRL